MTSKYLADLEEMNEALKLVNSRIVRNVAVETPDTIGQNFVYHIALDKRARFYPNISKRAGASEDNTLPRVHTALSLAGCWFGYASGGQMVVDYIPQKTKGKVSENSNKSSAYRGGFYIHRIPFRVGLRPGTNLVYDSDYTNEIWLSTYNEMTTSFPAEVVGLMFPYSVTYRPRTGDRPIEIATVCVEIKENMNIRLYHTNKWIKKNSKLPDFLVEGYWMFDISDAFGIENIRNIGKKEFDQNKLRNAGMLSYT